MVEEKGIPRDFRALGIFICLLGSLQHLAASELSLKLFVELGVPFDCALEVDAEIIRDLIGVAQPFAGFPGVSVSLLIHKLVQIRVTKLGIPAGEESHGEVVELQTVTLISNPLRLAGLLLLFGLALLALNLTIIRSNSGADNTNVTSLAVFPAQRNFQVADVTKLHREGLNPGHDGLDLLGIALVVRIEVVITDALVPVTIVMNLLKNHLLGAGCASPAFGFGEAIQPN